MHDHLLFTQYFFNIIIETWKRTKSILHLQQLKGPLALYAQALNLKKVLIFYIELIVQPQKCIIATEKMQKKLHKQLTQIQNA